MSKKIVLILDKMIRAGTQRHVLHLLKGFQGQFEFHIVCLEGRGPWDAQIRNLGGHLHIYPLTRIYDLSGWQTILGLRKLIHFINPIGIETFMFTAHMSTALALSCQDHVPFISSRREKILWRKKIHFYCRKWANRKVDFHIANSQAVAKDVIEKELVREDRVVVIPNGIELEDSLAENNLLLDQTKVNIAVVAALKPVKQHRLLIDLVSLNKQKCDKIIFHFIGDGPLKGELKDLIRTKGLEKNFIFHGHLDSVSTITKQCSFGVLPSKSEGLSNSLMELMVLGLPVIGFDIDGNKELVKDQENGFLVEKNNIDQLFNAINILSKDDQLRLKMGQNACREIARRYSIERMCEQKLKIYQKVFKC